MAVTFKSNCAWRFRFGRRRAGARELEERVETWEGRYDELDAFLAEYPIGAAHNGGYIVAHDVEDTAPKSTVQLSVAMPPEFVTADPAPGTSIKTATKSATIESTEIIDGASTVTAIRTVSYYSPEARYEYFTEAQPEAPYFDTVGDSRTTVIIRNLIVATGDNGEIATFGSNAPAALSSALTMAPTVVALGPFAEPIKGTPWYRCSDHVSVELTGD